MPEVHRTDEFQYWFDGLKDLVGRKAILKAINRLEGNQATDVAMVGGGVSEARIHTGPGYRVYFVRQGREIVLLLCGGDKDSQSRDIRRAKALAANLASE